MLKNKDKASVREAHRRKFSAELLNSNIRAYFRKKYKLKVSDRDINKVWSEWVQMCISEPLGLGRVVEMDKSSKIFVKAIPINKHKRAIALREKGLAYVGGRITKANINFDTSKYIYKVVYESSKFKQGTKVFFKPHQNISKEVNKGVNRGKILNRF